MLVGMLVVGRAVIVSALLDPIALGSSSRVALLPPRFAVGPSNISGNLTSGCGAHLLVSGLVSSLIIPTS